MPYRNFAENFNRLSRARECYRQTDDRRQTDGRQQIANVNMSSRSLKTIVSLIVAVRGRVNEAIFNAGALKTWNAVEFGGLPT